MSEDSRDQAMAEAMRIDLVLPEVCLPGVIANRQLLDEHVARLESFLAEHPEA